MSVAVRSPAWERSREQRMEALVRANRVRTARADLKRLVRQGSLAVDVLLFEPPDCLLTAKVLDLLVCVPGIGIVKARRILRAHRISETKTVGGLSDRQRHELAARFA